MNFRIPLASTIPVFVYILLATATILPLTVFGLTIAVHSAFIAVLLLALGRSKVFQSSIVRSCMYLFPVFMIYALSSFRTGDPALMAERLEGAFLATAIVAPMTSLYFVKYGQARFRMAFIKTALVILAVTVLYKLTFGFFDRGVRFFINGPIVFGWLMGFAAITSIWLYLNKEGGKKNLFIALLFLIAVAWTESKGPFIASFAAISFLVLVKMRHRRAFITLVIIASGVLIFVKNVPESALYRFQEINHIMNRTIFSSDSGSIGIRQRMWSDAVDVFNKNPVFGVGVGNWQFHSDFGYYVYPHNMLIELASETGILGAGVVFSFLLFLFFRSSIWLKTTMLYFLICTSFSGDFSYFQFIAALPLAAVVASEFGKRAPVLRGKNKWS